MSNEEILLKPSQLEAVVYYSEEDRCFIAHSVECDQIGTGETKFEAVGDLGIGLKNCYNLCIKKEDIAFYRNAPKEIQDAVKKAKGNPLKYSPLMHEVPDYFWICSYDFTEENFSFS